MLLKLDSSDDYTTLNILKNLLKQNTCQKYIQYKDRFTQTNSNYLHQGGGKMAINYFFYLMGKC